MTSRIEDNCNVNTKYFKAIGLWQYVVERRVSWWVMLNILAGCLFLVNISIQLAITLSSGNEFSLFTEKLSVNLTIMESAVKIIYYCAKRSKLHTLSFCFKENLLLCSYHNALSTTKIMGDSSSLVNKTTKGFVIMIYSVVSVWNALPILKCILTGDCTSWNIMPSWYPRVLLNLPSLIYVYEFFIMVFCAALLYNVNCFFAGLALSLSSQFDLLSDSLRSIRKNTLAVERKDPKRRKLSIMDDFLRDCLIDHQLLLKLAKEMEDMYNPLFLIQMLASTFTICLVLVQINVHLSSNELPIAMTMKFLMYLMFGSMELLVYSWGGQILYDQAEEVHGSLYESGWNEGSRQFKKNIAIAMTRTMSPVYLSAGKFYRVDLNSFTQIIKASYSYFTFLHGSDSGGHS